MQYVRCSLERCTFHLHCAPWYGAIQLCTMHNSPWYAAIRLCTLHNSPCYYATPHCTMHKSPWYCAIQLRTLHNRFYCNILRPSTMDHAPWLVKFQFGVHRGMVHSHHQSSNFLLSILDIHNAPCTLVWCSSLFTRYYSLWYGPLPSYTMHHKAWNDALSLCTMQLGIVHFHYT